MRYTVKQVSALTGIAPDTLRAWERRYAVVTPARSQSRYRLYDDRDLERLTLMARLVAEGAPASLAAQQVESSLPDPVPGPTPGLTENGTPVDAGGPGASAPPSFDLAPDALVVAARDLDRAHVDAALDRAFATGSFEAVAEHWLLPALREVGAAWADGRIDVAGEHLVSGAVRGRLGRAFDAAGSALGGPVVLVGLPPGSLHELGSLTFAICLRRLGADVRWLGADLPTQSWTHAADRLDPAGAVLTVATGADHAATTDVVSRLREGHPAMPVFVGGGGAGDIADAVPLSTSVTEAARQVLLHLREERRLAGG